MDNSLKDWQDKTNSQPIEQAVKEQSEADFAATHDGCKTFIDYFNTHRDEAVLIFGHSDPRTLEEKVLHSIVKHVKKSLGVKNKKYLD